MNSKITWIVISVAAVLVAGVGVWLMIPSGQSSSNDIVVVPAPAPSMPIPTPAPAPGAAPAPTNKPAPNAPAVPRPPAAAATAAISTEDIAAITAQIQGTSDEHAKGVAELRALSTGDIHNLGIGLPKWLPPLLLTKEYDVIADITPPAILERSYDSAMLQAAQRARTLSFVAQKKFPQALIEAKRYYNVASMVQTSEAIELLCEVLAVTNDPATAARFKTEQDATTPAPTPAKTVLQSIVTDGSEFSDTITALQNRSSSAKGFSPSNWMSRGNLQLLSDNPTEARHCFEEACKVAGTKAKDIRLAIEGVAIAIRAQTGQVAAANLFISSMQGDPATTGANMMGPHNATPGPTELQAAAMQTKPATVQ